MTNTTTAADLATSAISLVPAAHLAAARATLAAARAGDRNECGFLQLEMVGAYEVAEEAGNAVEAAACAVFGMLATYVVYAGEDGDEYEAAAALESMQSHLAALDV